MEDANGYADMFPLFSIKRQLYTLCRTWNNEFQSLFVDVKVLLKNSKSELQETIVDKNENDGDSSDSSFCKESLKEMVSEMADSMWVLLLCLSSGSSMWSVAASLA